MKVTIQIHGELQRHTDGASRMELDVPAGTTVAQVMERLGVPQAEVFTVVVNRRMVAEETALQEGDRVDLIPPIGGG